MSVTVRVPPPWRNLLGDRREVDLEGATVREVVGNLISAHPELTDRIYDSDGRLNSAVAVFVNQDSIGRLSGLNTPVADGDRIVILMVIAGG